MKKLSSALFLLFLSLPVYADTIRCYSGNKLIYSRHVRDITYTGDMLVFQELGSDKFVLAYTNCIAKIDI